MKKIVTILLLLLSVSSHSQTSNTDPLKDEDLTFFEEFVFDVIPPAGVRSQKKNIKRLFKGDKEKLHKYVSEIEKEENRERRKALRDSPFMVYLFLGLYYECENPNPEKSMLYYSVAHEWVTKHSGLSDAEIYLTKRFIKNQRKHDKTCLKGTQFAGAKQIKQLVKARAEQYLEDSDYSDVAKRTEEMRKKIAEINRIIESLEEENIRIEREVDSLINMKEAKQVEIQGLTKDNYERALKDLQEFKNRGKGTIAPNVTEGLSGGARVVYRDGVATDVVAVENTGTSLGDYCSNQIKESTKKIVEAMLEFIDFEIRRQNLLEDQKNSLVVKLSLTGKSDGHRVVRSNGICMLKYKGETINTKYFSINDQKEKTITIRDGDPICDEELAFLRAYCADQQIRNYFRGKIRNENIVTEYVAKVHNEKGDVYRGVDINIDIENLFKYKTLEIEQRRFRQREIEVEIENKKKEKSVIQSSIEKLNAGYGKHIGRVEEQIKQIKSNQRK